MKSKIIIGVLMVITLFLIMSASKDDKLIVYSELDGPKAPMVPSIDVWEGTCDLKTFGKDSSPLDEGSTCLEISIKGKTSWWGIGIRALEGKQDISDYKYLVASLKTKNYKSDFYIGFQSIKGYPSGHVTYKIKRKVLADKKWHQVYFDISDKTDYLKDCKVIFFVWNTDNYTKGKIYVDNVYFSKTKPE
jgi:hypothetical protein